MFGSRLLGLGRTAGLALRTTVERCLVPPLSRGMASTKHKKMIKWAKGYRGRANRCFRIAIQRVEKAWQYSYRDRKVKKRDFRRLWITRINAATRQYGLPYGRFISGMLNKDVNIELNRKVLSDMAASEPLSFKAVVDVVLQNDPYLLARAERFEKERLEKEGLPALLSEFNELRMEYFESQIKSQL
ncbi:hypothetical protein M885DRAFT_514738 [Pelagophyceae sp. CCMP2097]|nr:hypothetical protein M885DRAFT_514738 [Pelagophyceae sp. CCMP2097]